MSVASLADIPMSALMEQILPFRSAKYLEDFREKLLGEGIAAPSDLMLASAAALETKLSTHASFNFIEMADAISLRGAMDPDKPQARKPDRQNERRGRSRSPEGRRGRNNRDHSSGGGGRGQRNNSRPHRNNKPRANSSEKSKPELWGAIERGDEAAVQQLLSQGKDPEEKFEGWTPLMKAAEEGRVEVIRMLLSKKVDLEGHNKKGRTALSFAAAPSFNSVTKTERDTPVGALRLLLQSGADSKRKDDRGYTAKDMASKGKNAREDAIAIFEEFGF